MEMIRLDPPATLDMPIGEAMFTQRAIRRLDPNRPITDPHMAGDTTITSSASADPLMVSA